jgi:type II secretory pathway component PulJ
MLVAIVLVGILTAALFSALRFGTHAVSAVDRALDHSGQLSLVYGFLQARLSNAQPFPASAERGQHEILFNGNPDRMEFVTTAPAQLAVGGFFVLRLEPAQDGAQTGLVTSWRGVARRRGRGVDAELPPSTLLEHIDKAQFAYFGAFSADDANEWHDRWQATDHLPSMVRLRVDFADGWHGPDLIFAPRLAAAPEAGE